MKLGKIGTIFKDNNFRIEKLIKNTVGQSKLFPILIKNIRNFEFWQQLFGNFICCETTNYNENFHCVKARFLNKVHNYGKSSVARICASILQYNEGYSCILDTLKKLHTNIISIHGLAGLTGFLAKRTEP